MADNEKPVDVADVDYSQFAGLTGWPLLEQFVNELDTGMVNGHNDDINTFMTFAGLFSAVLTGLIVISFALLQPDVTNNGNQKLDHIFIALNRISMQLFNSSTPPFVPMPEDTASFEPFRSSLWINSLWFLSLVLSMAAALLGMIAKQWLREFLSWTTMSGLSERQVLLRHIRYESFLEWQVPAIIAFIPVLLETSLIMFLVGLCILLGTLNDRVVFGLCTGAVAVLVLLTIAVTVLPVRYPRCPYKSPAGWAVLHGWQAARFLLRRIVHLSQSLMCATSVGSTVIAVRRNGSEWKDWRQRELDDRERVTTSRMDKQPRIYSQYSDRLHGYTTPKAIVNIKDSFRALRWITDTSQNTRILRTVEECTATYPQSWSSYSRLVMSFHIACELLNIDLCRLVPLEESCVDLRGSDFQTVVKLVNNYSGSSKFRFQVLLRLQLELEGRSQKWEEEEQTINPPPSMAIQLAHSIARDLSVSVDIDKRYNTLHVMGRYGSQGDYYLQAATVLAVFLVQSAALSERRTSPQLSSVAERFAAVFDQLSRIKSTPRLTLLCAPLYRGIRFCEARLGRKFLLSSEDAPRFTRLALRFPGADPAGWCTDECELFVRICADALHEWDTQDEPMASLRGELLPPLFTSMQACADRCREVEEWSCILLWSDSLSSSFDNDYPNVPLNLFPHGLVEALTQCRVAAQAAGASIDSYASDRLTDLAQLSQELSHCAPEEANSRASILGGHDSSSRLPSSDTSHHQSTPRSQPVDHAETTLVDSHSPPFNYATEEQKLHLPIDALSVFPHEDALAPEAADPVATVSNDLDPPNVASSAIAELSQAQHRVMSEAGV